MSTESACGVPPSLKHLPPAHLLVMSLKGGKGRGALPGKMVPNLIIMSALSAVFFYKSISRKSRLHTTGMFDKRCSSSLLHNALFCAAAITSGGSCLIAVVANLEIKNQGKL